jgi:hypothetical protein
MVQSGYYDGVCDYFNANIIYGKWILWKTKKDRMSGYRSGHMMCLRKQDLENYMKTLELL